MLHKVETQSVSSIQNIDKHLNSIDLISFSCFHIFHRRRPSAPLGYAVAAMTCTSTADDNIGPIHLVRPPNRIRERNATVHWPPNITTTTQTVIRVAAVGRRCGRRVQRSLAHCGQIYVALVVPGVRWRCGESASTFRCPSAHQLRGLSAQGTYTNAHMLRVHKKKTNM